VHVFVFYRLLSRLELVKPSGREWATLLQPTANGKVSLVSDTVLELTDSWQAGGESKEVKPQSVNIALSMVQRHTAEAKYSSSQS